MTKVEIYICLALSLALMACNVVVVNPEDPGNPQTEDSTVVVDPVTPDPVDSRTPDQDRNPDYLYDLSKVPEITITVTEQNWNRYLQNFDQNPNNGIYVPAHWTYTKDGVTYQRDSVGLRPRGNTSRVRPEGGNGEMHNPHNAEWHHAHFGIKFTEYTTGERFFGSDRVILKWHKCDPMYCREIYCYDLFRRFGVWSAPRACYCRLSIYVEGDEKPAYFGIYELVENPRKGWIHNHAKLGHISGENGNMWKAAWGASLSDQNASMGVSDDYTSYTYNLKTNKDTGLEAAKQELRDFIGGMTPLKSGSEELKQWLLQHMDVDLFLRAYAVNVMVGMWDDYWINANNYYFFFDDQHRFYFIPFDYDNTLGTDGMGIDPGTHDMLNWGSRGGDRILMRKVLSVKEFEDTYKRYIKELAAGEFSKEKSQARILEWHRMIEQYVNNDTGEDCAIYDEAANWGNNYHYHLLSDQNNFFTTKIGSIYW